MPIKYYECAFTDTDDYMLVPKDKMGEVVKAMEVMCSQGFPPNLAKERILEIFFTKGHVSNNHEPDVSTTPDTSKKEEPPEVVEDKRPPSTVDTKVDEPIQFSKNDNNTRKPPNPGESKVIKNTPIGNTKIVEEPKQHIKNRKCSSAGECKYNKNRDTVLSSAKAVHSTSNETTPSKEQLSPSTSVMNIVEKPMKCAKSDNGTERSSNTGECKHEEGTNRLKLDEIFSNSVEESTIDLISQLPSPRVASEERNKVAVEENTTLAPPVPAKNAKLDIPEPSCGKPVPSKAETFASHLAKSEVKEFSIPVPPPFPPTSMKDREHLAKSEVKEFSIPVPPPFPPTSMKDREDKSPTSKLLPPVSEAKQVIPQKNNKNPANPGLVREESLMCVNPKAKGSTSTISSKHDDNTLAQDKKRENKQRATTTPMSPSTVRPEAPPKETMMAGGECFAAVDGIGQETRSSSSATTSRRTSKVVQQRSRETDKTKTTLSKNISKSNNLQNKSWKKKNLVIAGGIGIAMICCYAIYKNKT